MSVIETRYPQQNPRKCPLCGGPVEMTKQVTQIEEGQANPVTSTTYECLNQSCRDQRIQEQKEKKAQAQSRLEQKEKHLQAMKARKAVAK